MAGKGFPKSSNQNLFEKKFELEIEKLRDENKWMRIRELIASIPNKDPKIEIQLKFYLAECDLESYLYSNPSIFSLNHSNDVISSATSTQSSDLEATTSLLFDESKKLLYDIETTFKDFISRTEHTSLEVQAAMLLGKLFYSQSRLDEANKLFHTLKVQKTLNEQIAYLKQQQIHGDKSDLSKLFSMRVLQIYAEAHSVRAMCLEALSRRITLNNAPQTKQSSGGVGADSMSSEQPKQQQSATSEQDTLILDSFQVASKLAIEHSLLVNQRFASASGGQSANNTTMTGSGSGTLGGQSSPVGGGGGVASGSGLVAGSSSSQQANMSVTGTGGPTTGSLGQSSGSAAVLVQGVTSGGLSPSLDAMTAVGADESLLDLINPLYEIALQKAPILYIKRGDLQTGIRKFRELLLKKNIQSITSIRQILLKKFAESLMFHIPLTQYVSLPRSIVEDKQKSLYKPLNQDEETLLCLTLSQYLASKEVMLLRHPQFRNIREYTSNNAITSLDMLMVFLAYHRSYNIIVDKIEMTMKYSFEQFYVWFQYGLTLICDQKYYKAYMVLKECVRMKPDHLTCHLLLARLAIENLFMINEAIEWCEKVNHLSGHKNKQALILLGCSTCVKAKQVMLHSTQIECYEKALSYFKKANSLDPNDFLAYYHIARCYAIFRQINEAIDWVQKALKLKPDDRESLHLLALLLTSTKNYEEAHTVISKACALFDDLETLFTKIKIEEVLYGFNYSVNSLLNLILIYKQKLAAPNENISARSSSAMSLSQPVLVNTAKNAATPNQNVESWSSFETASLLNLQNEYKINESIGKSLTALVTSDLIALKYGNSSDQAQNVEHLLILIRLLTQIGEFYLRHDRLHDAEMCCQEMASIHPMSYLYIYLKGRIYEYKEDYGQAKLCYQNALSINPYHIPSLQQIALVLCQLHNFHLAEKMIRDAIALNSSMPESWHILARILDYQNDNHSAIKCYQTCLQLEATNPIHPFTSLTRIL